jgi:SAM-dependent methyltransferase
MHTALKKQLIDLSTAPYRKTGRFNYQWARGKLRYDPIFSALIEQSVLPDGARILDLGCGRGLLAAWLLAAEHMAENGNWSDTVQPPKGLQFRGIELMEREANCGNQALQPFYGKRVQLYGGDMRNADMSNADVIAILDVLHYIPIDEQERMLDQIRATLKPGGIFVTRVGNAGNSLCFRISQLTDRCISFVQGHRLPGMWCRPADEWIRALENRGFSVQATPKSEGTPFANVMLVARVA